jgi:hypothetical protein
MNRVGNFMKTFFAKAAIRVLQFTGIIREDHETEDSCFIRLSKYYERLSPWQKEALFRIVRKAHPRAAVIRFKGADGEEFRCLSH